MISLSSSQTRFTSISNSYIICFIKASPAEVTNIMAAVGNFQEKLTEENKAEFVAKLDNIVTDFALKVPVEKGGNVMF